MNLNNKFIQHSKPWINKSDLNNINNLLKNSTLLDESINNDFENAICKYLDVNFAISDISGTSSLILALQILNIQEHDEVIIPSYVCSNVLDAVKFVGAKPVICDVSSKWVMTKEQIQDLITNRTKAIIAVHIFGLPVNIEALKNFKIPIIEDACQAFGMKINNKMAGTLGDIGIFSFDATKCLTTIRGGILVTNNRSIVEKIKYTKKNSKNLFNTLHLPLSAIQSILGLSQLSRYNYFLEKRKFISEKYFNVLGKYNQIKLVNHEVDFLFRFPIKFSKGFEFIQKKFIDKRIHVRRGVDNLLHRLIHLNDKLFPNSTENYLNTVSIPFYPALIEEEQDYILKSTIEIINEN